MDRKQLIEDAAKAMFYANMPTYMNRDQWDALWPEGDTKAAYTALAKAALVMFEGAYTPTDDERETLEKIAEPIIDAAMGDYGSGVYEAYSLPDAVLAAGFHRTVQGEPSDAQVVAALNAYDPRFPGEDLDDFQENEIADMRAALRAASNTI